MEEAVQFSCKKAHLAATPTCTAPAAPVPSTNGCTVVRSEVLQAYTHPLTGQKLAGPDAEPGPEPVEIDEAAYQETLPAPAAAISCPSAFRRPEEWRHLWLRQILPLPQKVPSMGPPLSGGPQGRKGTTAHGVFGVSSSRRRRRSRQPAASKSPSDSRRRRRHESPSRVGGALGGAEG